MSKLWDQVKASRNITIIQYNLYFTVTGGYQFFGCKQEVVLNGDDAVIGEI